MEIIQVDALLTASKSPKVQGNFMDTAWCVCDVCVNKKGCKSEGCNDYAIYARTKTDKARKKHYDNFMKLQSLSLRLMGHENNV